MKLYTPNWLWVCLSVGAFTCAEGLLAPQTALAKTPVTASGLPDAGQLTALEVANLGGLVLRGPDARQQLVVTGKYSSGQQRDLTWQCEYTAEPANIVRIDKTGLVSPLADGEVKITARHSSGVTGTATLTVKNFRDEVSINFPNQIVPIFSKLGCNSGGCHGKASGQNGFKLSLLGFEPTEDYEYLVKEGRGRRLFPAAPDTSLLLLKATNLSAHGGGRRLDPESHEYRLLRRWIAQGMPYGSDKDPTVARIEVFPTDRTLGRQGEQQVAVIAHYTDGSMEDVTRMAQFEPNDPEMAEVSLTGAVRTLDLTGDVAIMARYQSNVSVFRASIPLGVEVTNLPPVRNFIDELVFAKLKVLGVPPSAVCDDGTFLRRISVDLCGKLPSAEETKQFLADTDPNKRDKLIDRLLDSGDYADYFANKWNAVLRNKKRTAGQTRGTYGLHAWIRDSLQRNVPYDQFVRDILAASGDMSENPPVVWYREVKTTDQQVEDTAQLFLGLRIQCARCHHHPFERWSQRDYYGFAAFFSQVGRKNTPGVLQTDEQRIYHKLGMARATNPKTGESLTPTGLGAEPVAIPAGDDPRLALVDWMASPDNPFFAKALANRYWKHFFSRGIVDPEDDMRVTNPASNPALLDALGKHFIESKFDLKQLIRTICQSQTYQLGSEPNEYNVKDRQNYSRYYPKRLNAEVLYDALHQVTNTSPNFNGLPTGMRAVQLPDTAVNSYFLTVFGKPMADSACECERSAEANLAQSLHLLNSNEIQQKLTAGNGRAALLAKDKDRSDEDKVRELYLWGYARQPQPPELTIAVEYLQKHENKQAAFEDLVWVMLNSKEFLFNH